MKGLSFLLLCLLVVGGSAFTTKKPKRKQPHPIFTATTSTTTDETSSPKTTAFIPSAVQDHYEIQEEPAVSPGTAAIACLLTIAVGFGLGYGT